MVVDRGVRVGPFQGSENSKHFFLPLGIFEVLCWPILGPLWGIGWPVLGLWWPILGPSSGHVGVS